MAQSLTADGPYVEKTIGNVGDYTWDITSLARVWSAQGNYGLMIKSQEENNKRYKRFYSSDASTHKPSLQLTYQPINKNISASATAGGNNSSKGNIKVSWTAQTGVKTKVYLDGTATETAGSSYTWTNQVSGMDHKVKVEFYTTYGVKVTSEEKTIKIPDNSPPVFDDFGQAYIDSENKVALKFHPAVKPGSVTNVTFPTWSNANGQDDLVYHNAVHDGQGNWSCVISIADHKNEYGSYAIHLGGYNANNVRIAFGHIFPSINANGELYNVQKNVFTDSDPVCRDITAEPVSNTSFKITAYGLQSRNQIAKYEIYWAEAGKTEKHLIESIGGDEYQLISRAYDPQETGLPSGKTIYFSVKAFDKNGNYTTMDLPSNPVEIPNYITPQKASALSVTNAAGESYTFAETPLFGVKDTAEIHWEVEKGTDSEYDVSMIQYKVDDGEWLSIDPAQMTNSTAGPKQNGYAVPLDGKTEGLHTISVRGVDNNSAHPLSGPERTIQVLRDVTAPNVTMVYPEGEGEVPNWEYGDTVRITNVEDAQLKQVQAYIGKKLPWDLPGLPAVFAPVSLTYTKNEAGQDTWPADIALTGGQLTADGTYVLRVVATDTAGNQSVEEKTFNLTMPGQVEVQGKQLQLQYQAQNGAYCIENRINEIVFTATEGTTLPEGAVAKLFVDGHEAQATVNLETGQVRFTVDVLGEANAALFEQGKTKNLYAVVYDQTSGTKWVSQPVLVKTEELLIEEDTFAALTGFSVNQGALVNSAPQTGDSFEIQGVENGYGLLDGVTVTAEECPANVKFEVRFFDGSQYGAPVVVASGQTAVFDYQAPENAGKSPYGYKIKGIVTEGGNAAISLSQITIKETYITAADKTVTNLVKTPENLSAQAMVNYTTWLRWEDNEEKEGVYDVYRKAAGAIEEERIAENLTEPYCYDYNLMYGQSFEYRVVKKVSYAAGEDIKQAVSQASQSVSATMVDQAEMDKSLGLQDYWSYVTSDMGNGTGYINVASGNLVYQKTDFANTAPLLATVMRRTYNSQSRAGSGLGQGWDFSFNTNLLVEYGQEETGERVERAVLLKDGDGTVHRYEKQADGSYLAPNGIFLTLEKQADGRYKAVRSDDIVYMFNQNMMIESFAEPNGNQLLFRYDEKGRLVYVMHSQYAGETFTDAEKQYVELVYGEQPYNRDKIIMAKNVFAGAPGQQQTAQVYRYTYYDEPDQRHYGQLKRVETSVERPITIYNRQTNAQGEEEESVSESQERLTMYEEYEYPNTETPKVKIITPSNNGVGTRQSSLTLDETGRVTEYINANGDTSTLTYTDTEQGHRQTVITNKVDGHTLGSIGYRTDLANHGVVLQTTAVNGRKTYYENYTDTLQAQTMRTYQDSEETAAVVYQMAYDSRGNVLTITAPDGTVTTNSYVAGKNWLSGSTVSKNGTVLNRAAYTYDENGNLLTEKTAVSNPAAFTDTKTTAYTYNAQGLRVSQTDWNGRQTGYTYDKFGRLSESTVSGSGISQTTRYTYDAYNNLATATAERGAQDITTQTQYDALGYLVKSTDPTGMKQAYRYNANGLQTETLTMGYTSAGAFVEAKKTTVQYDEINRAIQTTLADGTVQTVDVSGKEGAIETNTESTGTDGVVRTGKTQTAADGSYVKQTSLGLGSKTTYDYIGNMNRVVQIHGETEERGVNAAYDVMGRTTHVWDDTFSVESYTEYDDLGNVCREWTYVKTEGETRKYAVKAYTHDLEGRVTSVKEYTNLLPHGEIGNGEPVQTTAYRYDESAGAGLTKQTVTDAEGGVSESYFNQLGQTVKQVQKGRNSEKQIVTVCSYDAYGRQTEVKQGDQTSQTTKQSYEYDAYDRIKTQRTNGSTYTELAYDHFGRRNRMTDHTDSTQIVSSWLYNKRDQAQYVMQDGKIMGFTYNSAGEMTTIRYSAGNTMEIEGAVRTVAYEYDELGRLTAVKSGVVDTSNASLDTTNVKTVKDYTYAENGDLATSREYMEFDTKADLQGVSLVQSYAYDAVGRTTEVTYKQGEAVKEKYTQSYDGRNYITQDSYTDGYGSTAKTLNRTYQYDAIGRLTETGVTNGEKTKTTGYLYDKVGNRLYQTVADGTKTVSTKYTYNALGQLTKTQKGLGQAQNVANWYNEEIYTYDNYGNRTGTEVYEVNEGITGSEKIGDVRYSYDESNQMVKYETKGTEEESWTEKARNVYNGEGMRIRQYENGNSWARQYFYIGGALAISTDGSNENFVKSENILTPDGTILAALREAKAGEEIEGNAYWIYHYDARGSATNLVGAKNGSLYRAEENIYDAFGNKEEEIKQSTSSVVNDIKFTGAVLDNSGTYYLGSRHYDSNTGRFLQQDTFKGEAYSPWTQNLYTYTSNNPVNYVDPTGHICGAITGIIGGAVVGFFVSLVKGENVWNGAKAGAISGLTLGVGTDMIASGLLTGGVTTYFGIGFVAGVFGNATSQANDYKDRNGSLQGFSLDREEAFKAGLVSGGVNIIMGPATSFTNKVFEQEIEDKLIRSIARNQLKLGGVATSETLTYIGDLAMDTYTTKKRVKTGKAPLKKKGNSNKPKIQFGKNKSGPKSIQQLMYEERMKNDFRLKEMDRKIRDKFGPPKYR